MISSRNIYCLLYAKCGLVPVLLSKNEETLALSDLII